jgi:glycosyltransferase involved in cell wall biosynthesis
LTQRTHLDNLSIHNSDVKPEVLSAETTGVDISVIVPFFNTERYIEDCIQALLTQSYPSTRYEVIMIDNNSTDGSTAIVRKYPRIKLLSEKKQGAYAARNRGIAASRGQIIAFTDPDCVPGSDWLQQIDPMMRSSSVRVVVGSHQSAKHSLALQILEEYENEKNKFIFSSRIGTIYYGYTNNMAVRKTLIDELGPFVEIPRGSDVILVRRCVDRYSCDSVVYSPSIRVRHLEIDSAWRYFSKVFTYGRSLQTYGKIANARSITNRERFFVLRQTVKNHNYSWMKCIVLFSVLSTGFLYWIFGCIGAACKQKQRAKS